MFALWQHIDQYNMKPDPRARLFQNCPHQEVILEPGDVLLIPPYYWHSVRNLDSRTHAVATRWGGQRSKGAVLALVQ